MAWLGCWLIHGSFLALKLLIRSIPWCWRALEKYIELLRMKNCHHHHYHSCNHCCSCSHQCSHPSNNHCAQQDMNDHRIWWHDYWYHHRSSSSSSSSFSLSSSSILSSSTIYGIHWLSWAWAHNNPSWQLKKMVWWERQLIIIKRARFF